MYKSKPFKLPSGMKPCGNPWIDTEGYPWVDIAGTPWVDIEGYPWVDNNGP